MKKAIILALLGATSLAGCAQKSNEVQATYVSPLTYQHLSCRQIDTEARRVAARTAELSGVQDQNAQDDAAATAVALVLFWPAAFFIKGDKANAAELSRLKGEMDALEVRSNEKNCGIVFRADPTEPAAAN